MAAMTTSSRGTPTAANDSRAGSVTATRAVTHLPRTPGHRRVPCVIWQRQAVCWTSVFVLAGICLVGAPPASAAPLCHRGSATDSVVGRPTSKVAWRAELLGRASVYRVVSRAGTRARIFVGPAQASWLLVLDAAHTNHLPGERQKAVTRKRTVSTGTAGDQHSGRMYDYRLPRRDANPPCGPRSSREAAAGNSLHLHWNSR